MFSNIAWSYPFLLSDLFHTYKSLQAKLLVASTCMVPWNHIKTTGGIGPIVFQNFL
jgi:hypothetical protein